MCCSLCSINVLYTLYHNSVCGVKTISLNMYLVVMTSSTLILNHLYVFSTKVTSQVCTYLGKPLHEPFLTLKFTQQINMQCLQIHELLAALFTQIE